MPDAHVFDVLIDEWLNNLTDDDVYDEMQFFFLLF